MYKSESVFIKRTWDGELVRRRQRVERRSQFVVGGAVESSATADGVGQQVVQDVLAVLRGWGTTVHTSSSRLARLQQTIVVIAALLGRAAGEEGMCGKSKERVDLK